MQLEVRKEIAFMDAESHQLYEDLKKSIGRRGRRRNGKVTSVSRTNISTKASTMYSLTANVYGNTCETN